MILNARDFKPLPVYGDGLYVRDWIHVTDHCRGVLAALEEGRPGRVYNFGARNEAPNLDIVHQILSHLDRPHDLIRHVQDRPGHDRRYAIDPQRAEMELGWKPRVTFPEGLADTIAWYENHQEWVARVTTGVYREYYNSMYGSRLSASS
jgi:dTDP-glucose 4,6-dehydratase